MDLVEIITLICVFLFYIKVKMLLVIIKWYHVKVR